MKSDLAQVAHQYLQNLLQKDRFAAEALIRETLDKGVPIKDVYLKVFQPSQWEIGRLWQTNKITVAMEHYCTAATQFIMSRLYEHIFTTDKNGLSFVATSVSGELHELGIRMVSDFFEMEGWNTYYLGASTSNEGIAEMVSNVNADILAISATIYFNIPQAKDLIEFIRKHNTNPKLKIMVGGKAFNINQSLWKDVNADIFAYDAEDAIKKANQITNIN